MTVRKGETGVAIYVIVSYDVSANTSLAIKAVAPSGAVKTFLGTAGGTLTNITLEDGTVVTTVPIYQSIFYVLTNTTDLDEVGTWTLVATYTNTGTNPDTYLISDPCQLEVLADGFS